MKELLAQSSLIFVRRLSKVAKEITVSYSLPHSINHRELEYLLRNARAAIIDHNVSDHDKFWMRLPEKIDGSIRKCLPRHLHYEVEENDNYTLAYHCGEVKALGKITVKSLSKGIMRKTPEYIRFAYDSPKRDGFSFYKGAISSFDDKSILVLTESPLGVQYKKFRLDRMGDFMRGDPPLFYPGGTRLIISLNVTKKSNYALLSLKLIEQE